MNTQTELVTLGAAVRTGMETNQKLLSKISKKNEYKQSRKKYWAITFSNLIIHTINNFFCAKTFSCSVRRIRARLLIQAYVERRMQAGPPQCCKRNRASGGYSCTTAFTWSIWALMENNGELLKCWLRVAGWVSNPVPLILLFFATSLSH